MAIFEVDVMDAHERDQIHQYAEFIHSVVLGGYLVTVRSIHHEPACSYQPIPFPGRAEGAGRFCKCSVMPNGVHVHLYHSENAGRYLRFVDVSDAENEALFALYYG